jgi:hypothetical protein
VIIGVAGRGVDAGWNLDISFLDLAEDIAIEARLALARPTLPAGFLVSCGRDIRCGITTSGIRRHRDRDGP